MEKLFCIEDDIVELRNLIGIVKLAEPSGDYNSFYGAIKLQGHPSSSEIKVDNILFAGSKIKGSAPVIGFLRIFELKATFYSILSLIERSIVE